MNENKTDSDLQFKCVWGASSAKNLTAILKVNMPCNDYKTLLSFKLLNKYITILYF